MLHTHHSKQAVNLTLLLYSYCSTPSPWGQVIIVSPAPCCVELCALMLGVTRSDSKY